jgi:hypothetical protein
MEGFQKKAQKKLKPIVLFIVPYILRTTHTAMGAVSL